jgi:hypothetical protein
LGGFPCGGQRHHGLNQNYYYLKEMKMSKITVNFKNLCALFTQKLDDELMVGLPDLTDFYGVPEADYHYPKITIETEKKIINPNGDVIFVPQSWTYEGFLRTKGNCSHDGGAHPEHAPSEDAEHIFGAVLLDVHGVTPGITQKLTEKQTSDLKARETARRIKAGEMAAEGEEIAIEGFNKVLDIQKRLHSGEKLKVDPTLCKARFHFWHGALFSISKLPQVAVVFEPPNPNNVDDNYPIEAGLEIELSGDAYAVMRFSNTDVEDFVFQGGQHQNYHVTIENSPLEHQHGGDPRHFKYYYKLVVPSNPPFQMYLPTVELPPNSDPFCMNGGFGEADYENPPQ